MKSLRRRIETLEIGLILPVGAIRKANGKYLIPPPKIHIRFGHVTQHLPANYEGERHLIVHKRLPDQAGQEWVEYAEVEVPAPTPERPDLARDILLEVVFVAPMEAEA